MPCCLNSAPARPTDDPGLELLPLRRPLVAVLPFTAADDDQALQLLGGELADTVREALAGAPAFGAILISSDFLQRAPEHAVELICRQLRVGHLVAGRCYRTAIGASLYLELTDTRTWYVRWAHFGDALALLAGEGSVLRMLQTALQAALRSRPWR